MRYVCGVVGEGCAGVANVGVKPTIGESLEATPGVHVLEGSPDLYGERLTVRFRHKLRDEQKFPSLDALKAVSRRTRPMPRHGLRNTDKV